MKSFICVGRDRKTHRFVYKHESHKAQGEWLYLVFTDPPLKSGEFFELTVKEIDDYSVRVIMMAHHNEEAYKAKGIPDALLPIIRDELGKIVTSSPSMGVEAGVYRTVDATEVWKRLEKKGMAIYDRVQDIYRLLS